jgi:release factor glutamine methyltransferase
VSTERSPHATRDDVAARLRDAGFVAAEDEAEELFDTSSGRDDVLESLVRRRLTGEPLAWITGFATFCGLRISMDRDVYVPRWQSEPLAYRAIERLAPHGTAVDLCTGSGALAATLMSARPRSRVVATELDGRAARCARRNGVTVYEGDLFDSLPSFFEGRVDVVVGVVPYVPTAALTTLPRDTLTFESTTAYDGGTDGTGVLRRAIQHSGRFLRPGGALLLELGGDQAELLRDELTSSGFVDLEILIDEDGDARGIEATWCP